MLNVYPRALTEGLSLSSRDLAHQTWFDLVDPTEAERSAFERASGLRVPSKNELGEIEATSRLQIKNDALPHISEKHRPVHGALDHKWCGHSALSQGAHKGDSFPSSMRRVVGQSLATPSASVAAPSRYSCRFRR